MEKSEKRDINIALTPCIIIAENSSLEETIGAFDKNNVDTGAVLKDNKIIGILTKQNLLEAYYYSKGMEKGVSNLISKKIKIMCRPLVTDQLFYELSYNCEHILIIDEKEKIEGVLSLNNLSEYILKETIRFTMAFQREPTTGRRYINDKRPFDGKNQLKNVIQNLHDIKIWYQELDQAFENAPNSFVILNGEGITVRVNKEFENITGISREKVTGVNVRTMEEKGYYNPSIGLLILKEKRKLSIIQKFETNKEALVTAVPVFDENKNVFRIIINAINIEELNIINKYFNQQNESVKSNKPTKKESFISKSESMNSILQLSNDIKNVDSTILISGESGVGKGMVARYIHDTGQRKRQRMIEVNCGALPESLLESELLGYESGAFSGAKKGGKPGLIEMADKGTLLLDEIGEMPLHLQVKLLQVIQDKKIMRVGGNQPIEVDVRIIAATNKDLYKMVQKGTFRLDLYYRLNVIPVYIPPLRERQEDINYLIDFFLEKYNNKYNKNVAVSDGFKQSMIYYEWPGNVRELENSMERLVVTSPSKLIEESDEQYFFVNNLTPNKFSHANNEPQKHINLEDAVNQLEKKLIERAYQEYGNSYKVAEALGISQATAYRKIKKYL
ncbi:MAG: CBS domain-containing protein [Tindallia sp. MSAO_Bac2]|nr:MAG: CBS domain-containing protein [Tindallia sp. MSAO_Bac2]